MKAVGIICEYNPFHNGHLFHIEETRKLFPNHAIILVMSGHFTQRGEPSIISKWDKTEIALHFGVDLVIELPFPFAVQSADTFAAGAISILKHLGATELVFGSESNNVDKLTRLATIQLENANYQDKIKSLLKEGKNYPTALSLALEELSGENIFSPNDILGLSYIRESIKQKTNIHTTTIQRTNTYHETELTGAISSATSIRNSLQNKDDISISVPEFALHFYKNKLHFKDDYFTLLKYQIFASWNELNLIFMVDEGIENRIKEFIKRAKNYEELLMLVKTKRYTYQRLNRMFTYILCRFTKKEATTYKDITYLRILGFSKKGQFYLNKIKKNIEIPLVTRFASCCDPMLQREQIITMIYSGVLKDKDQVELVEKEYKTPPLTS